MTPLLPPATHLPLLALLATVLMVGNVLPRARQPLPRAFLGVLLGNCVWLGGDILAAMTPDPHTQWTLGEVQFLGILTVPVAWLVLALRHLQPDPEPVPPRRLLALLAVPLLTLALILTNGQHQLIWRLPPGAPATWETVQRLPLYWLTVVGYANVMLAWGAARLLPAWRAARGAERHQITVMLFAMLAPSLANVAYLLGALTLPGGISPVSVFLAAGLVPVAWAMRHYGLLRVAPLVHRQIVEQLGDAVFVLDTQGRVLDTNGRAAALAGQPAPALRGRRLTQVFPGWPDLPDDRRVEWRPGDQVWELQGSTVRNARGVALGQAVVARDVTARAHEHARVQRLANEDTLTGLGNRRAFEADLARETARASRHALTMGVAMIDLDGLKAVNDLHGHAHGDALLSAFGRALPGAFRPEDRAYRLGGDEFALLLAHSAVEGVPAIHERVAQVVRDVQDRGFPEMDASVGVAYFPGDGQGDALVAVADARMYAQKLERRAGRTAPRA